VAGLDSSLWQSVLQPLAAADNPQVLCAAFIIRLPPSLCSSCRVADMLPRCSDAGISVKYGRKVLQRLQAVGPARSALQAALAAAPSCCEELEATLSACKSCRCLLEDDLLQVRRLTMCDHI
jgi:hypothetical protein